MHTQPDANRDKNKIGKSRFDFYGGANESPLYKYLKSQIGFQGFDEHPYKKNFEQMFAETDSNWDKNPDIKWNFTKFIIDRNGNVVKRFEPTADMTKVEDFIKTLI